MSSLVGTLAISVVWALAFRGLWGFNHLIASLVVVVFAIVAFWAMPKLSRREALEDILLVPFVNSLGTVIALLGFIHPWIAIIAAVLGYVYLVQAEVRIWGFRLAALDDWERSLSVIVAVGIPLGMVLRLIAHRGGS